MSNLLHNNNDRYKYINLPLFLLAACVNSFPPNSFSAIAPHTRQIYEVSQIVVNLNTAIYPLMYIFLIFPVNYILDVYGIKIGTLIGQGFISVGLAVRLLMNQSFYFFLIGTWISSFGFLFMLNSPNKFSALWFSAKQIPFINSLCLFALFASSTIGAVIPAIFLDQNSTKQDYFNFFEKQSIIVIFIQLLMGGFFKGQPKAPQNEISKAKRDHPLQALKSLINKNYILMFISMSLIFGALGLLATTFSWQLKAFNIPSINVGILIVVLNVTGMIGAAISGVILGKKKQYKRWTIIYSFGSALFYFLFLVSLQIQSQIMMYVCGSFLGFFIFPYLTTLSDFAAQISFPIGQATATGTLLLGGQLIGFAGGLGISFLFDGNSLTKTRIGSFIELMFFVIGWLVIFWVKQDLRRSKFQTQNTSQIFQDSSFSLSTKINQSCIKEQKD